MRVKKYHPAWWRRLIARPVVRFILQGIFRLLAPVKITGVTNVPRGKPYIVAINHVSIFDPPFAGAFWPEQLEAMGAAEVWRKPGQNILARLWGGIPVHRGDYDRVMFETVLAVLRSGHPLLIAPEGGRSHVPGLRQAKTGIAVIAEQSGMPVIPVAIVGTTDDFWKRATQGKRPVLEMHIGKPLLLKPANRPGEDRRAARQEHADLVMRTIAGMLPVAYRGVYADRVILPESPPDQ